VPTDLVEPPLAPSWGPRSGGRSVQVARQGLWSAGARRHHVEPEARPA